MLPIIALSVCLISACAADSFLDGETAVDRGNVTIFNPGNSTNITTVLPLYSNYSLPANFNQSESANTSQTLSKRGIYTYTLYAGSSQTVNILSDINEIDFSFSSTYSDALSYYLMETSNVAACVQPLYTCVYRAACSCLNSLSCSSKCTGLSASKRYSLVIKNYNTYSVETSGTLTSYICTAGSSISAGYCSYCYGGYYSSFDGADSCTSCPAGSYSYSGAKNCSTCSAGYYSSSSSSYCNMCNAGYYSAAGASSCTPCAVGYTSYGGSSFCTPVSLSVKSGAFTRDVSIISIITISILTLLYVF